MVNQELTATIRFGILRVFFGGLLMVCFIGCKFETENGAIIYIFFFKRYLNQTQVKIIGEEYMYNCESNYDFQVSDSMDFTAYP